MTLLSVEGLRVEFPTDEGSVEAVDGIDFTVDRGEVVCLVGETGSGKTAVCEALTRLADGATIEGSIRFDGREVTDCDDRSLREIRGGRIAHVFQQPGTSLDPVYTVGDQIIEAIRLHDDISRSEARERAVSLLEDVGIAAPEERVDAYPHQLSGGMRQRVAIATALAADPDLLVADEPTTALDVTIQAGVLELLRELGTERDLAVLLVTHDLGVVAELADRVVVLYDGRVMERGGVSAVFERPAHPYTRMLLGSLRGMGTETATETRPTPADTGCPFRPECPYAVSDCSSGYPDFHPASETDIHEAACVFYGPDYDIESLRGGDQR
jgi:peptide/nickel transport system ATP-binding protein